MLRYNHLFYQLDIKIFIINLSFLEKILKKKGTKKTLLITLDKVFNYC